MWYSGKVYKGVVPNELRLFDEEGNKAEEFAAELTARGCLKAADFVNFCDAFGIPVLTLTNVKGYEATMCAEKGIDFDSEFTNFKKSLGV